MFVLVKPLLHLHSNKRLLSKFHGPFFSTHCNWYSELNLNCKTLFPTSTICKSKPIFQADLNVDFRALWFWYLSDNNRPNKLRFHSSSRYDLHLVVIDISSSSSLVRRRLSKPSTTAWSMVALRKSKIYLRETLTARKEGERTLREREISYRGENPLCIWIGLL